MTIKSILEQMAQDAVKSDKFLSEAWADPNNDIPEWSEEDIEAMIMSADVEELLSHEHIVGDPEAPEKSSANENPTAANKTKEKYRALKGGVGNVGVIYDGDALEDISRGISEGYKTHTVEMDIAGGHPALAGKKKIKVYAKDEAEAIRIATNNVENPRGAPGMKAGWTGRKVKSAKVTAIEESWTEPMTFKQHVDAAMKLIQMAKHHDSLAAQGSVHAKGHIKNAANFRAQAREHTRAASKLANRGLTESDKPITNPKHINPAMKVACPECGAAAGKSCKGGGAYKVIHTARFRALYKTAGIKESVEQLDEAQKKSAVQRHNEIVKKLGHSMAAKGHRDYMRQEPPGYKRTEDGLIIKESASAKDLVATAVRYHKAIKKSANNPKLAAKVGNHVDFAKQALATGDEETAIRRANAALSQRYVRLSEDFAAKMRDVGKAHRQALDSWQNEKDPAKKKIKATIVQQHALRMKQLQMQSSLSKKKLNEGYCHKDLEGEPLSHQPSPAHYAAAFDHHMDRAEEHKKRIEAIDNPPSTTVKTFGHSLRPAHVEWRDFHLSRAKYFYKKLKEIGGPLK